ALSVELARRRAAPEFVPEAAPSARALQTVDALVAAVVEEDDGDLQALLPRGDELAAQHEVAAVADERVHLAIRIGELHAERARDLVAHARVGVLGVVVVLGAAPPELLQVAGQAARGVDDRRALAGVLV